MGLAPDEIPNPATLAYYQALGYLPDAVLNGLARLGWSLDDRTERISREELIRSFALERVSSSPASFDPDKLLWLQAEYMKELPLERKVEGVMPFLVRARLIQEPLDSVVLDTVRHVVAIMGDRLKVFADIVPYGAFFFREQLIYDEHAVRKTLLKSGVPEVLSRAKEKLSATGPFEPGQIEQTVRHLAQELGISASSVIHPLRVATSGQAMGPGLFEMMAVLGKQRCLRRLEQTLSMLADRQRAASRQEGDPE